MRTLLFTLLLVTGCGIHVTSDPARVDHFVHVDIEGIAEYCQKVCNADERCFEDCFNRLVELLSDPQICVDLNNCIR